MTTTKELLEQLLERQDLSEAQAESLLTALIDPQLVPALAGALLAGLRCKGVTAEELRGLARGMRRLARQPQFPADVHAIDIVGTGGDSSGSLNISTGTALLTAACGVPVIKHGNRSVSSRSGSADVLEALGLQLPLDEIQAAACLAATHFSFLFAPYYHPAVKAIAPIRAALAVRTVFNILGPLSNPAQPAYYLLGAYSSEIAALMAQTLAGLPLQRAFVIHGAAGWDEPTPLGPFTVFDVREGKVTRETRAPEQYGLKKCTAADLQGADATYNAKALRAVFAGEERGAHRDCLLLGTALALEVAGIEKDITAAMMHANRALDSGAALRLVNQLPQFRS
jgi:anthranilate phosphoribosyltransferase